MAVKSTLHYSHALLLAVTVRFNCIELSSGRVITHSPQMYGINYGDGRGYQSWPKQPTQPSPQQPSVQLTSPTRQNLPQKSPEVSSERLWVDVRNTEEATMHHPQGLKSSVGKMHVTPPLDLSENRRQVESPLDLSVKTRKRCADTTEYAEQVARLGLTHDGFMKKRLCQTRDYAYPQGHPNYQQDSFSDKSYSGETSDRNKLIQQRQITMNKFSAPPRQLKPQSSPQPLPQTHYPVDVQRQHTSHPSRQQQQQQLQSLQPPQKHSTLPYGLSSQHQQALHPMSKSHSHPSYDTLPAMVNRAPQTNMTESVALKGFFEPTQKVTVNASSVAQPHIPVPQQPQFQRVPSDPHVVEHAALRHAQGTENVMHEFEESRRHPVDYPTPISSTAYSRRLQPNVVGLSGPSTDLEVMQSKQAQYERHLQQQHHQHQLQQQLTPKSQREQMILMAQRTQKSLSAKSVQEQQKIAYMMEMQKQAEARGPVSPAGTSAMYPSRSQFSSYSQTRQNVSATATYQDSLRKEKADFHTARCSRVTQPVTLSDIQQEHALALEHVHAVSIRPEMHSQQGINELNKYSSRIQDPISSERINQSRIQQSVRYEQTRFGVDRDMPERSVHYVERTDLSSVGGMALHPSVIQRPQGYIPSRIVRRGGPPSDTRVQRRPTEVSKEPQHIARFEVGQSEKNRSRLEIAHRERSLFQQKSQDMLSGKEVMKIQQRVAEQRGESHGSSIPSSRGSYDRLSATREHERIASNSSSNTYKHSVRRKSLPENQPRDTQSRDHHQSDESHMVEKSMASAAPGPTSVEVRRESISKSQPKITSPPCPPERSITKGTSGITKFPDNMDPFSKFLMRELKKRDDDNSVNPFANRSLLHEFDRSANSSPVRSLSGAQTENSENSSKNLNTEVEVDKHTPVSSSTVSENTSYALPLQIAIPGHKTCSQSVAHSVSTTVTTTSLTAVMSVPSSFSSSSTSQSQLSSTPARSSVITGSSKTDSSAKNPKLMSRKQMILSAFRMEEDLKNTNSVETVNIDQDERVPMESAKFAARKSERDQCVSYPTSPKMPILSPQERNRNSSAVGPAVGEPPNLEESSTSNSNKDCSKKDINGLEEHLHRLISDAVKGSKNKDKESVYETVRRELSSQPQVNKVFLSRQFSQTRNIPVANVAPIIHGKSVTDSIDGCDKSDSSNFKEELDEEDAKMADIVTRSLFGNQALLLKDIKPPQSTEQSESRTQCDNDVERSDSNLSFASVKEESIFDENSNSKRMSPGLKKLMLYRHRDGSCTSRDEDETGSVSKVKVEKGEKQTISNSFSEHIGDNAKSRRRRSDSKSRNVFGAFSEIVAQNSGSDKLDSSLAGDVIKTEVDDRLVESRWTGCKLQDPDEHDIHMVFNTDYDGDDEQVKDIHSARWTKPSNTKQHADRLIKKARHRRNSKQEASPTKRRKAKSSKLESSPSTRYSKRSASQEINHDPVQPKTRQRRASSLDRETKSKKSKAKQSCFSDNEVDSDNIVKRGKVVDAVVESDHTWHNEDESTDEDYLQNYESEFKQLTNSTENKFKKTAVKKRKGFHFKQTYIFQRKRKNNKSRARAAEQQQQHFQQDQIARANQGLDSIYRFHEEGTELGNLRGTFASLTPADHIPVPADLRRVTVNKDSGQTMLHRAVKMGLEEVVLYCLATGSVDVNVRDNAGYTALHECALRGRVIIGKHLLTYGADSNCCSTDGGIRPIHDAVENDHIEMVRLLLSYGADPTLSTYAGRSLMKIAKTERMLRFLRRYMSDLNGYATDEDGRPWKFQQHSSILPPDPGSGCAIFDSIPSDPEDETHDMFSFSSKPVFTTRRMALEPNKRVEDFLLLEDILQAYGISRHDLQSHGIHHLIKNLPMKTMLEFHQDSIYRENVLQKKDCNSIEVIRKVDSTQLISKLEKITSVHSKRAKN
ncbi:hypothetical protein ACF0H5_020470 [Mactra antiquata]